MLKAPESAYCDHFTEKIKTKNFFLHEESRELVHNLGLGAAFSLSNGRHGRPTLTYSRILMVEKKKKDSVTDGESGIEATSNIALGYVMHGKTVE